MKKLLLLCSVLFTSFITLSSSVSAQDYNFLDVVNENFEYVEDSVWIDTVLWANDGDITTSDSDVITGSKSFILNSNKSDGWDDLGGTSSEQLEIQDGKYHLNMKIKARNLNYVVIKIANASTHEKYYQFMIDPVTGKKVDDNGNEIPLEGSDSINIEDGYISLSITFDSLRDTSSYMIFSGLVNNSGASLVVDDFVLQKEFKQIEFRNVEMNNFDNSLGSVHSSSIFWVNDDEGTSGEFTNDNAIDNKSLEYTVNKVGWDILGGSQGDKIDIVGGHTYRVSFDVKLVDVEHFTLKVMTISNPEKLLYEVYLNNLGKRLPGSVPISSHENITVHDDYASVSFTFSSDIANDSYLLLSADSSVIGGKVILDNVMIEEEIYEKEYITFTDFYSNSFENNSLDGLEIGRDVNDDLMISNSISGEVSLELIPTNQFAWNEVLKTSVENIEIMNDLYKIHIKTKVEDIELVKIQLVRNDDYVVHEMYYNNSLVKRISSIGEEYLDNGLIEKSDGVTISQFEFPKLEEDQKYYIRLLVYPMSEDASVVVDDFNILKELGSITYDTDKHENPNDYTKPTNYLPTGNESDAVFTSVIRDNSIFGYILTGALLFVTLITVVILLMKRIKSYKISSIICLILMGTTLLTGIFTIKKNVSVEDIVENKVKNVNDYEYVYPQKIHGNLQNPGMGWVTLEEPTYGGHPDMGSSGDLPEVGNISLSTSWALIETNEGVYDWSLTDQIIDYYTKLGKRINLRICTDTLMLPNTYKAVPNWLMEKYNIPFETHNYTDSGPVRTFKVVDTRDPNYRRHLALFLEALAEKYKDNDYVDVIEIRAYGNWGEWHSGHSFENLDNRMNSLAYLIDKYNEAFSDTNKLLVLSAAWDPYFTPYDSYEDYYEISAFDYLMTLDNATFRRDSGGNLLNYYTDERLMSDAFRAGKRLPLLGEFASGIDDALSESHGFDLIGGIDDILFKMRPNYSTVLGWVNMNAAKLIEDGHGEIFDRGNELLGYRLAVDMARYPKKVSQSDEFTIMTSFSNKGVGVFWYDYNLKVSFINGNGKEVYSYINEDFDARTFILGEINNVYSNIDLPDDMPNGVYKVAVSIVDEEGNPQINLGMSGEIGESKMYELSTIMIDNNVDNINDLASKVSYSDINNYKFKPQTTYMVTFSYLPHFDKANYEFGNYDGYAFALTSKKGGSASTVGYTKWQDISEELGHKTVYFTTQDFSDYKLNILSEGYGDIDVYDVYIEEVGGYLETFENYDFTDMDSVYLPIKTKYANFSKTEDVISGKSSVTIEATEVGDVDAFKTDVNVFALEPNSTYTISYKFKSLSETGKGGYMYLNLESNSGSERIGEWYERGDTPVTTKTFTFNTKNDKDYSIVFGIHDAGKYVIDDIIITKHHDGKFIQGEDITGLINERPEIDFGGFGVLEDFEDLSFNANSFNWGKFGWGQFTINKEYVISGNSSLMGKIEPEALVNEWFEFAKTKLDVYQFQKNETYTLTFDYKVLKQPNNDGFFYLLYRSESLGISEDKGFLRFPSVTDAELGQVKSMSVDVTIGNAEDYQLIFGMHWQGEIVIDNVFISKKLD